MSSPDLEKELARLNDRIARVRKEQEKLEGELRAEEAELQRLSTHRQQFDALQQLCNALDKLRELKAEQLFWEDAAEAGKIAARLDAARGRVARFQAEINGILEKRAALKERLNRSRDELAFLQEDVRDAYDREARRDEEYVIEREISPVPLWTWSGEAGSERPFRKAMLIAAAAAAFFAIMIPLLHVPAPERPAVVVVPERLVSMLRKEPPKPPPPKEEKEQEKAQKEEEKPPEEKTAKEERPKPVTPEEKAARKKAESTGVLALRESFKELIADAPAPSRLGAAARLNSQGGGGGGSSRPGRSLVALPASAGAGSSGGIGNAGINRAISPDSGDRIAAVATAKVESKVARLTEEAQPLAAPAGGGAVSGSGSARTDEEIQIVFDKYKATLYRMYNTELRRNPALRGRLTLRITIEPGGEVSACAVQSNDLASPELVAQLVARVKKFNFGPKANVARVTILYPIDFLPGG